MGIHVSQGDSIRQNENVKQRVEFGCLRRVAVQLTLSFLILFLTKKWSFCFLVVLTHKNLPIRISKVLKNNSSFSGNPFVYLPCDREGFVLSCVLFGNLNMQDLEENWVGQSYENSLSSLSAKVDFSNWPLFHFLSSMTSSFL